MCPRRAHETCLGWAERHGARFSPEKYVLTHFTRKRNLDGDLRSQINIPGFDGKPVTGLRVLGVWVDRKINWKEHICHGVGSSQGVSQGTAVLAYYVL